MSDKALGGMSKVPRGGLPNARTAPEERYYRRFEASPVPTSVVSAANRSGAVTALRAAAEQDDAAHVAGIAEGGLEYVQKWLNLIADSVEGKEFEAVKDGKFDWGD